jgi:glycosyltransferase involved in cell wall biosynthesis
MIRVIHELYHVRRRNDFLAVIVGDGPALAELRALAQELRVSDKLHFTGMIPWSSVPAYVSSFDICITPDPSNAYNDSCTTMKTMEYMALGKPTVCFQTTENKKTAGDAALYADDNDVTDFTERVIELMDRPELRRSMGEIARTRIADGLTWQHQARKLLSLYRELFDLPSEKEQITDDARANGLQNQQRTATAESSDI